MKKIVFGLLLLLSNLSIAQESKEVKKETKFQVGVHYVGNLRNENIISNGFNGVVGISGNYSVYQDETISVFGGLTIDYLQSRDYFLPNNILIWNPNARRVFGCDRPENGATEIFVSLSPAKYDSDALFPRTPIQRRRLLRLAASARPAVGAADPRTGALDPAARAAGGDRCRPYRYGGERLLLCGPLRRVATRRGSRADGLQT